MKIVLAPDSFKESMTASEAVAAMRAGVLAVLPDAECVELKSLKYYLIEFRNRGIFYENATNQILDDLVACLQPRRMTVVGDFSVRGGITTKVTAEYRRV